MITEIKARTSGRTKTKGLLGRVDFSDKTDEILDVMCQIIVNGPESDYLFVFQEDRMRAVNLAGGELRVDMGLEKGIKMLDLERELMQRIGIISVEEAEKGAGYVKPTEMALELYEDLREADMLDERGYLRR